MDLNRQETLQLSNSKNLTKSHKRKLKKIAKRKDRKEKRKEKQLLEQRLSGKLIEENHNGNEYSPEFTEKSKNGYMNDLFEKFYYNIPNPYPDKFLIFIRSMRVKYQTLVLKWSSFYPRTWEFWLFVELLDSYRNDKINGMKLLQICENRFKENNLI